MCVNIKKQICREPNWHVTDWCFELIDSSLACRTWDDLVDPDLFWDNLRDTFSEEIDAFGLLYQIHFLKRHVKNTDFKNLRDRIWHANAADNAIYRKFAVAAWKDCWINTHSTPLYIQEFRQAVILPLK